MSICLLKIEIELKTLCNKSKRCVGYVYINWNDKGDGM